MRHIDLHMPRSFWSSVKAALVFSGLLLVWMVFKPVPHDLFIAGNMLSAPISLTIGMIISFSGKPRWWHMPGIPLREAIRTTRFWQPALFLLVAIDHYIAQVISVVVVFTSSMGAPAISWADFFFLTAYPLMTTFYFILPTRPLPSLGRVRMILNLLILMVIAATFSWYFILGPILLQNQVDLMTRLVSGAYPIGDLAFLLCLLQITGRVVDTRMRLGIVLFMLATSILIFQDVFIEYQTINGTYALGTLMDICVPLAYLCFGLAVHALRMAQIELPDQTRKAVERPVVKEVTLLSFAWVSSLPYVLIPLVIGLTFYVLQQGKTDLLARGVYAGSLTLILLVLVRQITLIRDVAIYAKITVQLNEELSHANGHLEAQATTDPLTGLPNHRALLSTLTNELERALRYQHACTLLFLDLDHFKALNDGYGHAVGDEVLIAFGQRLAQSVRGADTAGRWGGEEFVAILPQTTMTEAVIIAERIRADVGQQSFAIGGGLHLTCSIGVASYPAHATELTALINAADQAMYAAKHLGRNQYRTIDDPIVQSILATEHSEGDREEITLNGFATALLSLMKQRDAEREDHATQVADFAQRLAVQMNISANEAHIIHLAGLLHDIGKIGIPDAILQKASPLTLDELQQMKAHPTIGAEVVAHIPPLRPLAPVIRAHHERWDGTGYPDQLRGEDIPLAARIIVVADAYIIMSQNAQPVEDLLQEFQRGAATQFDPTVVQALLDLFLVKPLPARMYVETTQT